jgi:hypothetical protein
MTYLKTPEHDGGYWTFLCCLIFLILLLLFIELMSG